MIDDTEQARHAGRVTPPSPSTAPTEQDQANVMPPFAAPAGQQCASIKVLTDEQIGEIYDYQLAIDGKIEKAIVSTVRVAIAMTHSIGGERFTALTDEDIDAITVKHSTYLGGWEWSGDIIDVGQGCEYDYAREIEAEVVRRCRVQGGGNNDKSIESGTAPTVEVDERMRAIETLRSFWTGNYWKSVSHAECDLIDMAFAALASKPPAREADTEHERTMKLLTDPPYGPPDLYARLHQALTGEIQLAREQGKVREWFDAARSLLDYLASKEGITPAREAAERQSIDTPDFRDLLEKVHALNVIYGSPAYARFIAHINTWGGAAPAAGNTAQPKDE